MALQMLRLQRGVQPSMTIIEEIPRFFIKSYEGKESYLHKGAKELLYEWITEKWVEVDSAARCSIKFIDQETGRDVSLIDSQADFIYLEYPITKDFPYLIDEQTCIGIMGCRYRSIEKYCPCLRCPNFKIKNLQYIADIAIEHKGYISNIIEVVNKNPTSIAKKERIKADRFSGTHAFEIEARHILGQIGKPEQLFVRSF